MSGVEEKMEEESLERKLEKSNDVSITNCLSSAHQVYKYKFWASCVLCQNQTQEEMGILQVFYYTYDLGIPMDTAI